MQHGVEFCKVFGFQDRCEKIPLGIAHIAFHAAFLMSLRWSAVMALEQVVTAKGAEGSLLLAMMSFQDTEHCGLQVVVRDPL